MGSRSLVVAAGKGDLDEVRRLLDQGVDVDSTDASGRTAITAAVYGDHLEVVHALIEAGADVDIQDEIRTNPLLATGETGNVEILREVLRTEPDLTRTNRFGGTALIPAAHRGHVEVVRELVRTDIDIDHVNDPGWTALLEAVILGDGGPAHQEIVRTLVAAGATIDLADREDVTPLEHARSRGFEEITRILEAAESGSRDYFRPPASAPAPRFADPPCIPATAFAFAGARLVLAAAVYYAPSIRGRPDAASRCTGDLVVADERRTDLGRACCCQCRGGEHLLQLPDAESDQAATHGSPRAALLDLGHPSVPGGVPQDLLGRVQ